MGSHDTRGLPVWKHSSVGIFIIALGGVASLLIWLQETYADAMFVPDAQSKPDILWKLNPTIGEYIAGIEVVRVDRDTNVALFRLPMADITMEGLNARLVASGWGTSRALDSQGRTILIVARSPSGVKRPYLLVFERVANNLIYGGWDTDEDRNFWRRYDENKWRAWNGDRH